MRTFELSRPTVGAQALGIARAAYEYALDYAKTRVQFGRPIIENQAIAFALADMRTEIDAARLLVWRAAWMGRNNQPFTAGEGSMSKLKAGEVAVAVTEKAVQILGGAGYCATTRSSAGTATRRSTPSSRAPARSSAWSSPAPSPASRSVDPIVCVG